jgi:hypothetical protein
MMKGVGSLFRADQKLSRFQVRNRTKKTPDPFAETPGLSAGYSQYSLSRNSRFAIPSFQERPMRSRAISALIFLFAAVVLPLLAPFSAASAADPLDQLPSSAFLVIRFESLDKVVGNFKDMLGGIGPAAAVAGDGFAQGISEMLEVRGNLEMVDGKSPVVVAIFPHFDRPQPVVAIVKAKDEAKLQRAVLRVRDDEKDAKLETKKRDDGFDEVSRGGRKFYFAKRDGYVIYTRDEEIVKRFAESRDGKSIAATLGLRGVKLLTAGDAAMAVNVAPVVEKHKDDIEKAREKAYATIKGLPDEVLGGAGTAEAARKIYTDIVKLAFNAVYDVSWFAGNVTFSSAGARADGLVALKRFSMTDWVLMANPPSALGNLELLPPSASVYYGLNLNPFVMIGVMQEAFRMSYGGETKNPESLEKAAASLLEARPGATVASFSLPADEKTGMKTASIVETSAPKKLYEAYEQLMGAFGAMDNPLYTQSLEFKAGAEKYKKQVIDIINISFKLKNSDSEEGKLLGGMFRRFFGGEVLQERVTAVENLLVQVTGNDPKLIQNLLDSFESGETVGKEKAFVKTRDALGKEANLVVMVNAPQIVVDFVALLKDVPLIGEALKLAPFNFSLKPPASYAGFSLSTEPQGMRLRAFVPVEQPRGILQIFVPGL